MTNTILDRLLELYLRDDLSYEEKKEKIELKSQLESKLAESDKATTLRTKLLSSKTIREYLEKTVDEKIGLTESVILFNMMAEWFTKQNAYTELLSQYVNLVKAIQDKIVEFDIPINDTITLNHCSKCGRDANTSREQVKQELQNLLERTKA